MLSTLFRLTFWGGLALLVLPIPTQQDATAPSVGVIDALYAAKGVANDLKSICERQPTACDVGGRALETVKERAIISAQGLADYLAEQDRTQNSMSDPALITGAVEPVQASETAPVLEPTLAPAPSPRPQYP